MERRVTPFLTYGMMGYGRLWEHTSEWSLAKTWLVTLRLAHIALVARAHVVSGISEGDVVMNLQILDAGVRIVP
ncbi:MAG: hypothetical protein V1800_15435, partial [Candidatus Latescibacterota bacterium]